MSAPPGWLFLVAIWAVFIVGSIAGTMLGIWIRERH